MSMPRAWPSAATLLLFMAACVSGTALSTHAHDGFHPLVIAACMLPVQVMHGLMERCMEMLGLKPGEFAVRKGEEAVYLDGRCAEIFLTKTKQARPAARAVHDLPE